MGTKASKTGCCGEWGRSRGSERGRLRTPAATWAVMRAVGKRRWKEGLRGERKEAN